MKLSIYAYINCLELNLSLTLASAISKVPFFHFPVETCRLFQMETPSIADNDGEFCWELDVGLEFRLEERHVFVLWKLQLGL